MRWPTWPGRPRPTTSNGTSTTYWMRRSTNRFPPATRRLWAAPAEPLAGEHRAPFMRHQQVVHVVRMLLFDLQNTLQHGARPRVIIAEIADEFAVVIHRDSLGDQIFLDHLDQILCIAVFRSRTRGQAGGVEIGPSAELIDALRDLVHVAGLFLGVLRKF